MKTGLILEGGAMRGMFTAGVLDVWMEHGVRFDGAIGVSAGAAFGCNYKSGQIGRAIRYNKRFCADKRYCSVRSLLRTGNLFNADFCYRVVPEQLDLFDAEAYAADSMAFYLVATDVETGRAVYKRMDRVEGKDYEWFRASASLPLVSRPVEIGGRRYLDGGIADAVPLRYFEWKGYEKNVIILTRPRGYRKEPTGHGRAMRVLLHRYPQVARALARRHLVYNDTMAYVERREAAGAALVIRPAAALDIGRVERNPDRLQAVYEQGRAAGEAALPRLQAFLQAGEV